MTKAEKTAYEAGKTAAARIGDKAMCYDPIMSDLVVKARTARGEEYNRRIMTAWIKGRAAVDPGWLKLLQSEEEIDTLLPSI